MDKTSAIDFLGKTVEVKIDRKLGSYHPKYNFIYMLNYGYIENTLSEDNEELDAYLLGSYEPKDKIMGKVIAIIKRTIDDDDKLVVAVDNKDYTNDQIRALTDFQEKYFTSVIIRDNTPKIHNMKLQNEYYNYMLKGTKKIELRLYDEKRSQISLNDIIIFTNELTKESFKTKVQAIYLYNNFTNLINDFDISLLSSSTKTKEELLTTLNTFYTSADQEKYGVVGIKIELIK